MSNEDGITLELTRDEAFLVRDALALLSLECHKRALLDDGCLHPGPKSVGNDAALLQKRIKRRLIG